MNIINIPYKFSVKDLAKEGSTSEPEEDLEENEDEVFEDDDEFEDEEEEEEEEGPA